MYIMSSCRRFICAELYNEKYCKNTGEKCTGKSCTYVFGNCLMCFQERCDLKGTEIKTSAGAESKQPESKKDIPHVDNNSKVNEGKHSIQWNTDVPENRMPYAYVDGSYNPYRKIYGYGGVFYDGERIHVLQGNGKKEDMVSMRNVAGEIDGAIAAINFAKDHDIKEFTMYYDYTGIEQWATGKWQANKVGTQNYQKIVRGCGLRIHFVKVKGHSGVKGNEMADKLAKQSVGL